MTHQLPAHPTVPDVPQLSSASPPSTRRAARLILANICAGLLLVAATGVANAGAPLAADDYDKASAQGWANADVGGAYVETGPADAYSSDGETARITLTSPGQSAMAVLEDVSALDTDVSFRVSADREPTGLGQSALAAVRHVNLGTQYRIRVRFDAARRVTVAVLAVVDGRIRHVGTPRTISGLRIGAGQWLRVRAQVVGRSPTTIRVRVWEARLTQPTSWHYVAQDGSAALQRSGSVGLGARLAVSSESAPVTFAFDELRVRVPSVDPVPDPPPSGGASFEQRPYLGDSVWNQPIASDARLDPASEAMVATIGLSANEGKLSSDPTQYSYPVYVADAATPRVTVTCTGYCSIVHPDGTREPSAKSMADVPIPDRARPSSGSDGQMIIIDPGTGYEYDVWQATRDASGGWVVRNMSRYNVGWDGMPRQYISRGAGVPYLAGLIRPHEIAAGEIRHAIAFAYPFPAQGRCVWPASKNDGQSGLPAALPEGARLQLDPDLTEADFDRWGLDRTGRIIARAMQRYGVILIDVSGRPKLYAEDLGTNPYATTSWADVGGLDENTVAPIPYSALRVLDLPDGYWSRSSDGAMHGDCYR